MGLELGLVEVAKAIGPFFRFGKIGNPAASHLESGSNGTSDRRRTLMPATMFGSFELPPPGRLNPNPQVAAPRHHLQEQEHRLVGPPTLPIAASP